MHSPPASRSTGPFGSVCTGTTAELAHRRISGFELNRDALAVGLSGKMPQVLLSSIHFAGRQVTTLESRARVRIFTHALPTSDSESLPWRNPLWRSLWNSSRSDLQTRTGQDAGRHFAMAATLTRTPTANWRIDKDIDPDAPSNRPGRHRCLPPPVWPQPSRTSRRAALASSRASDRLPGGHTCAGPADGPVRVDRRRLDCGYERGLRAR